MIGLAIASGFIIGFTTFGGQNHSEPVRAARVIAQAIAILALGYSLS